MPMLLECATVALSLASLGQALMETASHSRLGIQTGRHYIVVDEYHENVKFCILYRLH